MHHCPTEQAWRQDRRGGWTARDSDGYQMRVSPKSGAWHWSLRPPGGGYAVMSGAAATLELAQEAVAAALADLYQQFRAAEARK